MAHDFRDAVFDGVLQIVRRDSRAMVLTNDMGAMGLTQIQEHYPGQVLNVGISEQNMISAAAGLALSGHAVFVYGIASHITTRCYEQLKLDVCGLKVPVFLLGMGPGLSYGVDGPTHHATHDCALLQTLPGMTLYIPSDGIAIQCMVEQAYRKGTPAYIRIDKDPYEPVYHPGQHDFSLGLSTVRQGESLCVITNGNMLPRVRDAASDLAMEGLDLTIVDLYRLNPCNETLLWKVCRCASAVVTVEEHGRTGGIGSVVGRLLAERGLSIPFAGLSLDDEILLGSASRAWAYARYGLEKDSLKKTFRKMALSAAAA
jgi:transketolase